MLCSRADTRCQEGRFKARRATTLIPGPKTTRKLLEAPYGAGRRRVCKLEKPLG